MNAIISGEEAKKLLAFLQRIEEGYTPTRQEEAELLEVEKLDCRELGLTSLPESIGYLSNLQSLDVSKNQLTDLPDSIGNLNHLVEMDFSDNPIHIFPEQLLKIKTLTHMNLANLNLHHLPSGIMNYGLDFKFQDYMDFRKEGGIFLKDTTLATQPISLFMQPRELIQAYFDAFKVPVNEGKVIFLGYGDIGKTFTIQRILNNDKRENYDTRMTPGISITSHPVQYEGKRFNIRFWDFGGQEVMHAMHRCFMTHRTCYVVMVSNRLAGLADLDGQARYWLRNIESFASGSQVLLVVNRWENYPTNDDLNTTQLYKEFKNIVGCVTVSAKCDDEEDFHQLTKRITQMAAKLDSTGMDFPIQWDNIRQSLIKKAEEGIYSVNQDEYYQICEENGLTDSNIRMWLLEWFNDLGNCFSYHLDTDKQELKAYKVLNPEWLTNAVYLLILKGKEFADNGVINRTGINKLLGNATNGTMPNVSYNEAECGYVLEVMRKFNLSLAVSEEREFIPALCPNQTPGELEPKAFSDHIAYELEYIYLPDSVIHQLMIYCYNQLKLSKCWRKGMVIEIAAMGLSAVVDMGGSDKLLKIDVYSTGRSPVWQLLQPLLDAIRKINIKLNLKTKDYVYAEEEGDIQKFPMSQILSVKQGSAKRKPGEYVQGTERDFSIAKILDKVYGPENVTSAELTLKER